MYFLQVRDNPLLNHPRLDALFHDTWALAIAGGDVIGSEVFFRAPLYPYVLALLYAVVGHEYYAVRIVQHAFGVASVVMVFALSRRFYNSRTSLLAAILVAVNPMLYYFESQLLFEPVLVFLAPVWLLVHTAAMSKQRLFPWFLSGVLLGLMSITRPTMLAIGLLTVVLADGKTQPASSRSAVWKRWVMCCCGLLLVVLPVTLRNALVGRDFVLIASQGGINFYVGNNPHADGFSASIREHGGISWEPSAETHHVAEHLGRKPLPSEESSYWYHQALEFIKEQPGAFLELLLKKAYLFWNRVEIPNNLDYDSFREYATLLKSNPIGFWIVGPFSLLGLALVYRNGSTGHRVLGWFTLSFFAVTILFFVSDRFRLPLIPVLSILASYGVCSLVDMAGSKSHGSLSLSVGLLGVFAWLVNSNAYVLKTASRERDIVMLGLIKLQQGESDSAIQYFQNALASNASYPGIRHNMGLAEWSRQNRDSATMWFHRELTLSPGYFGSLVALSQIQYGIGNVDSAAWYARKAIESKPYLPAGYIWFALARIAQKRTAEAESILTAGAKLCDPNEYVYGEYLRAEIRRREGASDEIEARYRSIISRTLQLTNRWQPLYEPEHGYSLEQKIGESPVTITARSYYGLAHVFLSRGVADSAIACFVRATSIDSQYSEAYADLGVTLMSRSRFDEAVASLQQAIRLRPESYLYWFNYGIALAYQGDLRNSIEALKQSLALNKDFSVARERLEMIEQEATRRKMNY